jgi:hypothetical protein
MKRATAVVAIWLTKAKDMVAPEAKDMVAPEAKNMVAPGAFSPPAATLSSVDVLMTAPIFAYLVIAQ